MTRPLVVACALLMLPTLSACGAKHEVAGVPRAEQLKLMLDFFPNADHAGIYAAKANGDFRRAGLDVNVLTPSDPSAPLKLLAAGKVDLAISYEPEVLLARDRGLRVVSVGALVQRPLTSVIAIGGSRVRSVRDLANKRVGTAGIPYQAAYLRTISQRAGVNPDSVHEISVGFNLVPAMLSKKVDATLGGFSNYEGIQLARRNKRPLVIPVDKLGVPTYDELVIVARRSSLAGGAAQVRRFMRALGQGYEAARTNPAAAVAALVKASPDLDPGLQLASVKATLPAFFPPAGKPFGYQSQRDWTRYGEWMLRNHLLKAPPDAGLALTNEFLPGEGI